MTEPRKRLSVVDQIRRGLEQSIAHVKGEITLKTTTTSSDDHPTLASQLATLREHHQLTRGEMARLLNISPRTLKGWEEGTSRPSRVAVRLIEVLQRTPEIVLQFAR